MSKYVAEIQISIQLQNSDSDYYSNYLHGFGFGFSSSFFFEPMISRNSQLDLKAAMKSFLHPSALSDILIVYFYSGTEIRPIDSILLIRIESSGRFKFKESTNEIQYD